MFIGCEQPDGSVGSLVSSSDNNRTLVVNLPVLIDTSYAMPATTTGGSAFLYVGSAHGVSADALLRFNKPTLPYDWRVNTARIELAYEGGIGSKAFPNLKGELLRFSWSEASTCEEIPALPFDFVEPAYEEFPGDTGVIVFPVNPQSIADWLPPADEQEEDTSDTESSEPGETGFGPVVLDDALTLKVNHSGLAHRLIRFHSRSVTSDSLKPRLLVFIDALDSSEGEWYPDTLDILPSGDLFRVQSEPVDIGDRLMVGSGAVIETALKFDMNQLIEASELSYVVVNRAVLNLSINRAGRQDFPETPSLWPFMFDDDRWLTRPALSAELGFVVTTTAIDPDEDRVQVVVTYPVSRWVETPEENHGMVLHSGGEGLDIDRVTFYSSEESDSTRRPYLSVYYTEFPK